MSTTASSLATRRQSLVARSADSASTRARGFSWGRFALRGLGTVVAAVLANTLFYFVGGALVAYDPDFLILSNPSGAMIFTVVPAIVAVLLYAGLVRFTRRPAAIFTVIGCTHENNRPLTPANGTPQTSDPTAPGIDPSVTDMPNPSSSSTPGMPNNDSRGSSMPGDRGTTEAAQPTIAPTIPPPPTIAPQPTIAPTLDNAPRATVNVAGGNANVRSGDSTLYNVILTVTNGTVLPIVGFSTSGSNWLLVDLPNGGRGWIAPSVVQIAGNTSALPRIAPPPPPITNTPTPLPATLTPTPNPTAANLVAGLIRLSANPPQCKTTFTVNVDIANLGTQDTTNSGTFLIQDIVDGAEVARAFGPIGPIGAGKTVRSPDIPITVSSKHDDTHTIKITLNVENTIPETNTGDDVNSTTYRLGGDCG